MEKLIAAVTIGNEVNRMYYGTQNAPQSLGEAISDILPAIFWFASILLLIYLSWGAYRYLLSGGDPKQVAAAKAQLTWAIIGIIIVFLSFGLFQILNEILLYSFRIW